MRTNIDLFTKDLLGLYGNAGKGKREYLLRPKYPRLGISVAMACLVIILSASIGGPSRNPHDRNAGLIRALDEHLAVEQERPVCLNRQAGCAGGNHRLHGAHSDD